MFTVAGEYHLILCVFTLFTSCGPVTGSQNVCIQHSVASLNPGDASVHLTKRVLALHIGPSEGGNRARTNT
jgi:hypothetical protein